MSSDSAIEPQSQSNFTRLAVRIGWGIFAAILLYAGNHWYDNREPITQLIVLQCGIAIILAVSLNIVNGFTGQFAIGHAGFMSVGAYTGASVTYFLQQNHYQVNAGTMLLGMILRRATRRRVRLDGRRSESAAARRLSGDCDAGVRRNYPHFDQ